ncbi:hypothetical protein [Govanella unica]|uniref:Uncharacterized protein n=1 Tax=Govanella unica TaxID=2975056 RepID=A0A9X3Z844_9PROT|nr:hypothetical protein [Govania unica]MDA5194703.1 hypothetical protein [Govania unica]
MTVMKLEDFEAMLACHGADARDWPLDNRMAAEALLRSSPEARALLAEARAVDRLLSEIPDPQAPARLKGDILARVNAEIIARAASAPARRVGFMRRFWPQMIGFAAASLLGVMVGAKTVAPLPDDMADASAYVLGYDGAAISLSMNEDQQ